MKNVSKSYKNKLETNENSLSSPKRGKQSGSGGAKSWCSRPADEAASAVPGPALTPTPGSGPTPHSTRPALAPDFQVLSSHSTCCPLFSLSPSLLVRASVHPEARLTRSPCSSTLDTSDSHNRTRAKGLVLNRTASTTKYRSSGKEVASDQRC